MYAQSPEPSPGSVIIDDGEVKHAWLRLASGKWSGCMICGDEDLTWGWSLILDDIGSSPYRVIPPEGVPEKAR